MLALRYVKFVLFVCLLTQTNTLLYANDTDQIRNLEKAFQNASSSKQQLRILTELIQSPDLPKEKQLSYANKGLEIAQTQQEPLASFSFSYKLGTLHQQAQQETRSDSFMTVAANIFLKSLDYEAESYPPKEMFPPKAVFESCYQVGSALQEKHQLIYALKYLLAAKEVSLNSQWLKQDEGLLSISRLEHQLGIVYLELEKWSNARKSLLISNDRHHKISHLNSALQHERAIILADLIHASVKVGNIEKALLYLKHQRNYTNLLNDAYLAERLYLSEARLSFYMHEFQSSVVAYQQAYEHCTKEVARCKVTVLFELAEVYERMEDFDQADESIHEGLEIAEKGRMIHLLASGYKKLALLREREEKYQEALDFHQEYLKKRKQLYLENESESLLLELREEIPFDEKGDELQGQLLEDKLLSRRQLGAIMIGSLLVFFTFLWIGLRYVKKRTDNQELASMNQELTWTIDQLKRSEERLKEANSFKSRLISIIGHDLRGPMSSIMGFGHLLENSANSISEQELRKFAVALRNSSESMFNLLNHLLQWAKAQSEDLDIKQEELQLSHLLDEIIRLNRAQANEKNIELLAECEDELCIQTDRYILNLILRNLVANAIKFTPSLGTIVLSAQGIEEKVRIQVEDNGIGMSKEVQERLFHTREHPTTIGTNNEKGSGLGLLICHEFAQKLGTELQVESEEGKGTRISFALPSI